MPITFRDGRKPPRPEDEAPRMKFAQIRQPAGALPPAPSLVDYVTKVATWPMYGNDSWGDCVWAMIGHTIQATTTYGQGATVTVSEDAVIKGYSDVTGFDPNAGAPGENPTDQGTVIQDALNYWRKTGVGGHKILAFAEVNVKDAEEVEAALSLFGHLQLGINFPDSAMDQFDQGEPWDVVKHARLEGGHAVSLGYTVDNSPQLVGRAANGNWKVVTWGQLQEMTPAFWAKYVEEAWVVVSPEWVSAAGSSPTGLDKAALNSVFTALTGKPGPFPDAPGPVPPPAPSPGDALAEFAALLRQWWAGVEGWLKKHGL